MPKALNLQSSREDMNDNTLKSGALLKHGEYSIIRVLGQGGFGITYQAEQVSLGRKVAVKEFFMKDICNRDESTSHVSVPSVGSKEVVSKFKDKFIKEARMLAGYKHPSIVKVHDVFEENGTAYYVMEYLEGGSLQSLVKSRGKLGEAEALQYIKDTAEALGYIHSRDTLHLDVKPGNIMLDSDGRAVLIDFGISKHIDNEGHLTSSTPLGISKGYAPFEQVAQEPDSSYSAATDIYSLGATLYFLLTGKHPYDASAILKGLPTGELEEAGVSRRTIAAISATMKVQKDDRPQSVEEFLKLLDSPVTDDEETTIQSSGTKEAKSDEPKKPSEPQPENKKPEGFPKWLFSVLAVLVAVVAVVLFANRIKLGGGIDPPVPTVDDTVQQSSPTTGTHNGHEWVDLGLSVKWATCNVGASSPEDYGDYFAWGETSPKSEYTWANLKYCNDTTGDSFSKYNQTGGTRDNRTVLELSDDAARVNWGGSWHMPTIAEFQELIDKCTWTWTTMNGKEGYKVVSKSNGNFIFLPAAGVRVGTSLYYAGGLGRYWSSSLLENYSDSDSARDLDFSSVSHDACNEGRYRGYSVRPVFR